MKFLSTWLRNRLTAASKWGIDASSMKFLSTWLRNSLIRKYGAWLAIPSSMKFLSTWLRNIGWLIDRYQVTTVLNEVPEHMAQEYHERYD